jgi:Tfp pilus assembly PilM family ATPase
MTFAKVFNLFPPPKFLNPPFAGISISDSAIHCVQFGKQDHALYIEKHGEKKIPPGVVSGGQVNDPKEVITLLQTLKKELGLSYVKFSLPEERGYLFTTKIPVVAPNEVRSVIDAKIEENVPVSPSELTFDYKVVNYAQADHLDVVVSALPTEVVGSYVDLAEKAGLSLVSLEIESQAIAQSVLPKVANGTVLIVNFAEEKVGLYVARDGVVRFTSTVPFLGEQVETSAPLLQEIKKLYVYWHTLKENANKPACQIGRIVVCGENFGEEIISFLSSNTQSPTSLGNVWVNAFDVNSSVPAIAFGDSLRYAAAVGLALPTSFLM